MSPSHNTEALPVRGPRIEILDSQGRAKSLKAQGISYAVGDKIELRCNSAPSKPAARLRWYLNEQEIPIPAAGNSSSSIRLASTQQQQPLGGDLSRMRSALASAELRVTPVEFRQHYKSIYSSHSTLSLVLQQEDLINSKISFKCLASMRQEVPLRSRQLIVLMPPVSASQAPSSSSALASVAGQSQSRRRDRERERGRREMQVSTDSMIALSAGSLAPLNQRTRPQNQRHSVARLQQDGARTKLISGANNNLMFDDNEQQMLYIYEEANAALGSTIIDTLEGLGAYLAKLADVALQEPEGGGGGSNNNNNKSASANYALQFSQATDNLEYIQLLRERAALAAGGKAGRGQTVAQSAAKQRLHAANSLVRSPFYLDENDPLRPIISWPPLEWGKLQPSGQMAIVAIPTSAGLTFAVPSRGTSGSEQHTNGQSAAGRATEEPHEQTRRIMLEGLLRNINCTCIEGSIDTRLSWLINDNPLDTRDTRFYPARASADHKQTLLSVGLMNSANTLAALMDSPPVGRAAGLISGSGHSQRSLKSLLAAYLSSASRNKVSAEASQQPAVPTSSDQIRFSCQAIHSMLLHSGSEMMTFDFNPPPNLDQIGAGNSIADRFAASSSNVIQATSASQSSSASSLLAGQSRTIQGSQSIIFLTLFAIILCSMDASIFDRKQIVPT